MHSPGKKYYVGFQSITGHACVKNADLALVLYLRRYVIRQSDEYIIKTIFAWKYVCLAMFFLRIGHFRSRADISQT
jgi:hypothetical protein